MVLIYEDKISRCIILKKILHNKISTYGIQDEELSIFCGDLILSHLSWVIHKGEKMYVGKDAWIGLKLLNRMFYYHKSSPL